jgi:hypothetical protein
VGFLATFFINKRADIIIYRSDIIATSFAQVDTKEVYDIFTAFEGYGCMDADAKWDPCWYWTFAPNSLNIIND